MFRFAVLACLLTCGVLAVKTKEVFISNTELRHTVDGEIVRGQDGNIVWHEPDGLYYFFGMDYGSCHEQSPTACTNTTFGACGVRDDHTITIYSSPDLSMDNWTLVNASAVPVGARPTGVYYRVDAKFHPVNKVWVMHVRWIQPPQMSAPTHIMSLTAPTVAGPYTIRNASISLAAGEGADDMIFIDDDGSAYLVYSARPAHSTAVDKLSDDWLTSMGPVDPSKYSSGLFGPKAVEAPAMFKRDGWYYITTGHLCCFCEGGSNLWTLASQSPLGPFKQLGDIGDVDGNPKLSVTHTQQTDVFRVGDQYVYFGNQWQSAPDKVKDHDLWFWQVLSFNGSSLLPNHLTWADNFTMTVPVASSYE